VLADKKQTFSDSSKTSNGADFRHGPPPPGAQKLGFPKYDGTEDPLGWLHKCELFFHSGRSVHVFSILSIAYMPHEGDAKVIIRDGTGNRCMRSFFEMRWMRQMMWIGNSGGASGMA